mgnify:CR=1 FL=1
MEAALKRIRNRVYELNRETDPPFFSIASPSLDLDKKIMVPKSYQFVEIKGKVNDKSLIRLRFLLNLCIFLLFLFLTLILTIFI